MGLSTDVSAASSESQVTFWKVAVLPLSGSAGRFSNRTASDKLSLGLVDSRRFDVAAYERVTRALDAADIPHEDGVGQLAPDQVKTITDSLKVDGYVTGSVSHDEETKKTTFSLRLMTKKGVSFGQVDFEVGEDLEPSELATAAQQVSNLLPYDGLVTRADEEIFLINLGEVQGLKVGSVLWGFELDDVKIADGEVIAKRRGISELEVVRLSTVSAWVKVVRGLRPAEMTKISLEEIELEAPKPTEEPRPKLKRPFLSFGTGVDFLTRDYLLVADAATVSSETTTFFSPAVSADWRATRMAFIDVEVSGDYRHGFIPLRQTLEDGTQQQFVAGLDQAIGVVKLSVTNGGQGRFSALRGFIGAGYRYNAFTIERQDPLLLTSDVYHQLLVGGGFAVPVIQYLGARQRRIFIFGEGYFAPYSSLRQTPVDNGSAEILGAFGTAGISGELTRALRVSAAWNIDITQSDFDPGGGSRGFVNAASEEFYQGLVVHLTYVFYR